MKKPIAIVTCRIVCGNFFFHKSNNLVIPVTTATCNMFLQHIELETTSESVLCMQHFHQRPSTPPAATLIGVNSSLRDPQLRERLSSNNKSSSRRRTRVEVTSTF